jgi:serine/threonine protein kinase
MMLPETIDRYQIISVSGHGGMAVVYRGFDPQRQQPVAIKVLMREYLHDPQFRARFKREIDIHSTFRHPAVVPIYGYGQFEGQLYLILGYMAGGTLQDRLREGKPLPLGEVLAVLERIAPALDMAHRQGIIHRDLKPSNILFDEQGRAFIGDFGVARLVEQTSQLTGNAMIGSAGYMSPEQARTGVVLDKFSDLYSLGVMAFVMLTGKLPYYDSNWVKMALKHVSEPVPDILAVNPGLPAGCQAFIYKALAKNPEERFSSAADLSGALAEIAHQAGAAPRQAAHLQARRIPEQGGAAEPSEALPRTAAPTPERVPTPRPFKPARPGFQAPFNPAPAVAKPAWYAFWRPFSRYLRFSSRLHKPSIPYITIPAALRPVLGFFGVPSTIALPKKMPAWVFYLLAALIFLALLVAVGLACYWLFFQRPAGASTSSWIYLALLPRRGAKEANRHGS